MGERPGKDMGRLASMLRIDVQGAEPHAGDPRHAPTNRLTMQTKTSRIAADPAICGGRPVISGTRMRVADVLELLAAGASRAQILADFDYLSDEDISAALAYAAETVDHCVIRAA